MPNDKGDFCRRLGIMTLAPTKKGKKTKLKDSISSESLAGLLEMIKATKITKFEPSFRAKLGFVYAGFDGKNLESQMELLAMLEKEGLLVRKSSVASLKCPDCSSYLLCLRLSCQSCGSGDVLKGQVIEHISCGNIDFDEKFLNDS
ncbi:MAG TPA: hypothetical protein VFA15_03710, partial [Nitrososphaera sp.]|nr:hypothetical protein [Nitrososphaera sp.]